MIDTLTFQFHLNHETNSCLIQDIKYAKVGLRKQDYVYGEKQYGKYVGGFEPFSVWYDSITRYILVTFNPKLILKKTPTSIDCDNIEKTVINFFEKTFKISINNVEDWYLNRIDYKVDYKIKSNTEKEVIYDLMKLTPKKLGKVVKKIFDTAVSYNPRNGYTQVMTYDKERQLVKISYEEAIAKGLDKDGFKGVMRTEVRIKNRKLNYNKRTWGLTKDLANYLQEDMAQYYFDKYVTKIWFSEPFYRIDIALKKIKFADILTLNMKQKLCNLITRIYYHGITNAEEHYKEIFTLETFKSHIKKIRCLGINPLTFNSKYNIEKMENFSIRS